ncbi:hypothetical protein AKJ16_DCAP13017 [Drosera capensis]
MYSMMFFLTVLPESLLRLEACHRFITLIPLSTSSFSPVFGYSGRNVRIVRFFLQWDLLSSPQIDRGSDIFRGESVWFHPSVFFFVKGVLKYWYERSVVVTAPLNDGSVVAAIVGLAGRCV